MAPLIRWALVRWAITGMFLAVCLVVIPGFVVLDNQDERIRAEGERRGELIGCIIRKYPKLVDALNDDRTKSILARGAEIQSIKRTLRLLRHPPPNLLPDLIRSEEARLKVLRGIQRNAEADPFTKGDPTECLLRIDDPPVKVTPGGAIRLTGSGDAARCYGHKITLSGRRGNDILHGTDHRDVIDGRRGNDLIVGFGGRDLICGGKGNDTINSGRGFDRVNCGRGVDNSQQAERHRRCEF